MKNYLLSNTQPHVNNHMTYNQNIAKILLTVCFATLKTHGQTGDWDDILQRTQPHYVFIIMSFVFNEFSNKFFICGFQENSLTFPGFPGFP